MAVQYLIYTILAVFVVGLLLKNRPILQKPIILIISFFSMLVVGYICKSYLENSSKFLEISIFGSRFLLEPIGVIFISMVIPLWFCNNLYTISYKRLNLEVDINRIFILVALSVLLAILIAISSSLIQTFVFYELLTVITYPLVANNLTDHEKKSAKFYLMFLLVTSMLFFLPSVVYLYAKYGVVNYDSFSEINVNEGWFLPILLLYGVSKAAIVPVHFWLPRAMVAPIPVSALLHAVAVVKSGIFILIKTYYYIFGFDFLNQLPQYYGVNIITILASFSLIVSSIFAIYQTTLKKLLAYSTINQLSLCILALSIFSKIGVLASILHMISHAFAKISLFFSAGYIYSTSRLTEIDDMSGIAKKFPIASGIIVINAFSIIGIPIFAGFISKAYILHAAYLEPVNYFILFVMAVSILFTANYFVRLIYKLYISSYKSEKKALYAESIKSSMIIAMILTTIITSVFWVFYMDIVTFLESRL